MTNYVVYITPEAWEETKSLPGHIRQQVRRTIQGLAVEPRPPASRSLAADDLAVELRRVRLDRWRIIYAVSDGEGTVDIVAVRKRPPYDYGDLSELLSKLR